MAHKISMIAAKHQIINRDVVFSVSKGTKKPKKLGELRVSKGNLMWIVGNGRSRYYISWQDFNDIMSKGGTVE